MAEPVKPTRRYDSPRRREQAAATRRDDPRRGPAAVRARGLRGDHDGGDRRRGRRRAEDRLRRLRDQERRAARALAPAAARRRGRRAGRPSARWYLEVLEEPDPERQLRLNARNSRAVKERAGAMLERDPRRRRRADPDIAALWDRIQTEFYDNQRAIVADACTRKGALRAGLDVDAGDRHPVDAQPPRRVAAARRRARLDAGAVRALVRRHRVRPAARAAPAAGERPRRHHPPAAARGTRSIGRAVVRGPG